MFILDPIFSCSQPNWITVVGGRFVKHSVWFKFQSGYRTTNWLYHKICGGITWRRIEDTEISWSKWELASNGDGTNATLILTHLSPVSHLIVVIAERFQLYIGNNFRIIQDWNFAHFNNWTELEKRLGWHIGIWLIFFSNIRWDNWTQNLLHYFI